MHGDMSMRWLICLFLPVISQTLYVPGEPGGDWSEEEILIVKAKLIRIASNGASAYYALNPGHSWNWRRMPTAAKFLRLGFHDCLKYTDGTGGCDGCLNEEGMWVTFNESFVNQRLYDDIELTNNNGLGPTAETLEGVYTDKDFPPNAPSLEVSLRESGKSRADLWALAAIVGVEYGIETNNAVCQDRNYDRVQPQCHHQQGLPDCEVHLLSAIQFQTGRADCITSASRPWITTKPEAHPSIMTNGEGTVEFFTKNFNFTGREIVAIMGGHSLGRLNVEHTLLPYVWTSRGTEMFNNHYYKLITNRDEWYFNDDACTKVGDAFGRIPQTRWVPHVREFTKNGGPVHWIHENYACPNCMWDTVDNDFHLDCCTNKPEENFCRPDNNRTLMSTISDDNNFNGGCERYRFIVGLDEMVLSAEMGLYKKFQVVNNTPTGCPGLQDFTSEKWLEENIYTWPLIDGIVQEPLCPFQDMAVPSGSEPLYSIFEEFADNQANWVRDFKSSFEKMLYNGYGPTLNNAPDQWTNVTCPKPRRWSGDWVICYKNLKQAEPSDEIPFYIQSDWTSTSMTMVLQMNETTGEVQTYELNEMQPNQLWRWSLSGDQLINVATNTSLNIGGQLFWKYENGMVICIHSNQAIDCYNDHTQYNGAPLGTWTQNEALWQKYTLKPSYIPPIETTGRAFYIESGWTSNGLTMVIQHDLESGNPEMWELNGDLNQLWKWAADGLRIINEQTNQPLVVSQNEKWNVTSGSPYGAMNVVGSPNCIDCYNGDNQVDGSIPTIWTCNEAPWQQFRLSDAPSTTTAPPTTTLPCIEPNTLYGSRAFKTKKLPSVEKCRQLCARTKKCRTFVWFDKRYKKKKLRSKCQMKSKISKARPMKFVFSGLKKNC